MILFYSARRSELASIEVDGLPRRKKKTYKLFTKLKLAKKAAGGVVLVIDPAIDGSWLSLVLGDDAISVSEVPRRWIVNIEPYARPMVVNAAGGVISRVKDGQRQVLLIYRRGYWDLPKGKRDEGESTKDCARREIMEEVGVSSVDIRQPLGETVHGYREEDWYAVKMTRWFEMQTNEAGLLPQREEGIEKVQWFPLEEAIGLLGYPTLRSLLRRASESLCR